MNQVYYLYSCPIAPISLRFLVELRLTDWGTVSVLHFKIISEQFFFDRSEGHISPLDFSKFNRNVFLVQNLIKCTFSIFLLNIKRVNDRGHPGSLQCWGFKNIMRLGTRSWLTFLSAGISFSAKWNFARKWITVLQTA